MRSWAPVRVVLGDRDGHRRFTVVAVGGLLAGGAMAAFGLPPVDLHGPLHYVGVMDPLCGGTRSVHALMSGDLGMAWRYNPISFPLVAGAVGLLVRHGLGMVRGRWVNVGIVNRWAFWSITAALLVGLEVNQQLHVELLRTSPGRSPLAGPLSLAAPPDQG